MGCARKCPLHRYNRLASRTYGRYIASYTPVTQALHSPTSVQEFFTTKDTYHEEKPDGFQNFVPFLSFVVKSLAEIEPLGGKDMTSDLMLKFYGV
jgi:hypothetical protein